MSELSIITPKIHNPFGSFYVCCWQDEKDGSLHPHIQTISHTTNGCAEKAKEILGLRSPYMRKKRGFVILPFTMELVPAWTVVAGEDINER